MITDIINGITRLTASDGMVLTKGDSRGTEVWLSPTALVSDWREVSADTPDLLDPEAVIAEMEGLL